MSEKLKKLREILHNEKIDCLIIPHQDEFGSEDVSPWAQRLAFITGFKGSAGYAFIFREKAFLFVDGRYSIAAKKQVSEKDFTVVGLSFANMQKILSENIKNNETVAYDVNLHSLKGVELIKKLCQKSGASVVPLDKNPVDSIWEDRPKPPNTQIFIHNVKYAGVAHGEKIAGVCEILKQKKQEAAVLNSPADVCWLLNVRAADAPYTPLALSFAIVHQNETVDWFIDSTRVSNDIKTFLGDKIRILPPAVFSAELQRLARKGAKVNLDAAHVSAGIENNITSNGGKACLDENIIALMKTVKNDVEVKGMYDAHKKDGAAVCSFFAWLEEKIQNENLNGLQVINEYQAAMKVDEFRSKQELFFSPSFRTISAFGENSAIVHYAPSEDKSAKITKNGVYLLDSGAQYLNGTTDVTRTIAIGNVSEKAKKMFTLVLKGHIALAEAVFPEGTYGNTLDVLARKFLWKEGCDYSHGTGHGVGFFSCVHEAPPTFSPVRDSICLMENMVISDEPGYYEEGNFGIRCENLLLVKKNAKYQNMLDFDVLTKIPFDKNMMMPDLLTQSEKQWLNEYHEKVLADILPMVDKKTSDWLKKAGEKI